MSEPSTQGGRSGAYARFGETVERGLANGIPRDARLYLLGRISYAGERGDLTVEQVQELEGRLGLDVDFDEVVEFGTFGERVSEEAE